MSHLRKAFVANTPFVERNRDLSLVKEVSDEWEGKEEGDCVISFLISVIAAIKSTASLDLSPDDNFVAIFVHFDGLEPNEPLSFVP